MNLVWVLASAAILPLEVVSPTLLGTLFVIAQAIIVAGFAEAQFIGLRRHEALA
jgi:hypothetical protein